MSLRPCTPTTPHDDSVEGCYDWCPNNLAANCHRCKCRTCAECQDTQVTADAPISVPTADVSPAVSASPPNPASEPQGVLRRPPALLSSALPPPPPPPLRLLERLQPPPPPPPPPSPPPSPLPPLLLHHSPLPRPETMTDDLEALQSDVSQLLDKVSNDAGVAKDEVVILSMMIASLLSMCCLLAYILYYRGKRGNWPQRGRLATRLTQRKDGHTRLPVELPAAQTLSDCSDNTASDHSDDNSSQPASKAEGQPGEGVPDSDAKCKPGSQQTLTTAMEPKPPPPSPLAPTPSAPSLSTATQPDAGAVGRPQTPPPEGGVRAAPGGPASVRIEGGMSVVSHRTRLEVRGGTVGSLRYFIFGAAGKRGLLEDFRPLRTAQTFSVLQHNALDS